MKTIIKSAADAVCLGAIFPLYLLYIFHKLLGLEERFFPDVSQFLSLLPGLPGSYLRKAFYRLAMTRCAGDCLIQFGTIFAQRDTEIGRGVYIGAHCNIGTCRLEDHCTLGSNVNILSGRRQHSFDELDTPVQHQGGRLDKITIGQDTWIGNGSIIMANIGKKCIIGAGSVVTRDVEDFSVVAGNPAKLIRKRT
jgi:acetyltransferase-like isoleucine patch superfamily enzyme